MNHGQLLKESLAAIDRLEARLRDSETRRHEPLAIVGAGCRYPGGIEDLDGLWRVVRDGVDAVSEVPADRWDRDAHYSPDPKAPGKMITKRGGFLTQVDRFDPQLFGISPREAATMDPQQRLLLETSWEALESAAIATDRLSGSATGVFVGITTSDYGQMLRLGGPEHSDVYSATGSALNAAAGRIAFTFGFQGPCVAVDTACSSSLVAVHLACQSLRAGESDLALAGGVNVILSPDAMILFSKWGMMAPDGACKTFDASADGFVRAEGCAVVAIKRLSDAIAARDPILAVIRGSAVNSDGRSSGLTVPNGPAQRAVLKKALASAELAPSDIDYVEAHGTGTSLGDPIEIEALGAVMREGRAADRPLLIGSIKTNLGHTEAASGLAGLLKVVTALRHEAVPPHLHFSRPNPGIPWADLPLSVPTALTPWARGSRVRRAGVSSFGFSGTNAHVILEEAPQFVALSAAVASSNIVVLSARDDAGLRETTRRTARFLAADKAASLDDVALTTATGRAHLGRRVAFVAESKLNLERDLRLFADGQTPLGSVEGTVRPGERPKVAFLFTGQGAQYAGMGKGLYASEPVFREALDRAAAILAPLLGMPLLEVLFPRDGGATPLGETGDTQPALFALEYALTELWRSWGIAPSIVLGHSVGEYVAATVAGALTLEDGLALIAERGRLMQTLPTGGGMAALFADESSALRRIAPYGDRVSIAALNGPEETVISGDSTAIAEILAACTAEGAKSRALDVSHAFHSARLDPILGAFERRVASVAIAAPRLALVSNLTGMPFAAGAAPDAAYFRRHAREPVRFGAGIDALRAAGVTAIVEVGPHPALLGLVARALPAASWATAASLRRGRDDRREMLTALATLYARGASISWDAVHAGRGGRRTSMPTHPFQRTRHWIDGGPKARSAETHGHPLLGERRDVASAPGTYVWETSVSLHSHPWLRDHRVQGAAIVPATAYIEMTLAAGAEVLGSGVLSVRNIENLKPLILHEGDSRRLQATLVVEETGGARFSVHSRRDESPWTAHVSARLSEFDATDAGASRASAHDELESVKRRCGTEVDGAAFYDALAGKGNGWGPCFQGMAHVWIGDGEAVGRVEVPAPLVGETARYRFHPAVSDACGHALVATVPLGNEGGKASGAFVGGGVGEIRFHRSPSTRTLWTHAKLRPRCAGQERIVVGDVRVYDDAGALVSETLDARLWYLDEQAGGAIRGAPEDWFYEVRWKQEPLGAPSERAAGAGTWIVVADSSGLAEAVVARRASVGERTVRVVVGDAWSFDGRTATIRRSEPDDLSRLLDAVPDVTALVHLASIGVAQKAALEAGPEAVIQLLHAFLERPGRRRFRLWLGTCDTQHVVQADAVGAPFGAALWGLGRTLSVEHAELWGGLVDFGPSTDPSLAADLLAREIDAGTADDLVAFRDAKRYVARLEHRRPSDGRREYAARAGGTYLVTGGLGGIGLEMARWLVERGARHLLLLGRSPLPTRESWAELPSYSAAARKVAGIRALESLGARVETASIDVAEVGPLERCLVARRDRGEPAPCGVIHAAGVLQFQALGSENTASLRSAVAAKVDGAWRLHELLRAETLDCFVLCSSSSALLRSPLLGAYASGNAFLDALAQHRRAKGLPALSINWGTWGEVGMAAEAGRSKGGDLLSGMSVISNAEGLAALQELLETNATHAAVMPVAWKELARAYPTFAKDPFVNALVGDARSAEPHRPGNTATLAELRAATADGRPELLKIYLRGEAARTLGMAADGVDPASPLSLLGFDSLMAVQLKNQIEADLGVVVPMIQFLEGPSVDQLAPSVLAAMDVSPAERITIAPVAEVWEEGSV